MANPHRRDSDEQDYVYDPLQHQQATSPSMSSQQLAPAGVDAQTKALTRIQILTPLSILISLVSVGVCSFVIDPSLALVSARNDTYLSPSTSLLGIYWAVLYSLQIGFSVLLVASRANETKDMLVKDVNIGLAVCNFIMAIWAPLWVLNRHVTFIVGSVLLDISGLILLVSVVMLSFRHPASTRHPLDWIFVHVPIKMFMMVTVQVDIWQQLFIVLGWTAPNLKPSVWPAFIIIISLSLLTSLWIFAMADLTVAAAGIYLHVAVLLNNNKVKLRLRPAELIAALILGIALQAVALFASLAWSRLQRRREGQIALPITEEEEQAARRQASEQQRVLAGYRDDDTGPHLAEALTDNLDEPVEAPSASHAPTASQLEEGRPTGGSVAVTRKLGSK